MAFDGLKPNRPSIGECYRFGRELGRGHFGVVRTCSDKSTGEHLACKTILKDKIQKEEDLREFAAEMTTMIHLHGTPGLVQLREIFDDDLAVHLVMEFCQGGDYFDHIARKKRLSEGEAANIFRQVVVSVNAMHGKGFVHRDLKPENILIAKPASHSNEDVEVKIADFGLAIPVHEGEGIKGVVGSPFYMAPEVIKGKLYGVEVDVWSLGVILYTSLAGVLPFWGKGHQAVFTAICRAQPDFDRSPWPLISTEAKHLIRRMLTLDPTKRIRACDILEHPWMKSAHANGAPRRRSSLLRKVFGDISVQWPANLIPGISGLGGAAPAPPASTPADPVATSDDSKAETCSAKEGEKGASGPSIPPASPAKDAASESVEVKDSASEERKAVVPVMVPAPAVNGCVANGDEGSGTAALRALKPVPNQSRENAGVTTAGVPRFNALKASCIGAENHPPAGQQVISVESHSAPRVCPVGGISVDISSGCVFSNDSSDGCSDSTVYSDGSTEAGDFSSDDSNSSQPREEYLPSPRTPPSRRSGAANEREIVGSSNNGQKNRQVQNNHQLAYSIAHPFPGLYACPNSPSFTPSPSAIAGANGGHQLGPFASGVGFCWPAGIFSPPDNARGSMCLPDQQQQVSPMSPRLPPQVGFPELQPLPPTLYSALGSESASATPLLRMPMPTPDSSHGFVTPQSSQADAGVSDPAHLVAVPSISDNIPVSPSQLSSSATLSSAPESVALEIDLVAAWDEQEAGAASHGDDSDSDNGGDAVDGDDEEGAADPVTEMAADAVSEMAEDAVSEMGTGTLEDLLAAALAFDSPSSASPASSRSSSSSDVSAAFSLGSSKLSWTGFNPPALPALPSPAPLPAVPAWPPNGEVAPLRHEVSLDPQGTPVLGQAGVGSPSPSAGGSLVASPGSLVPAPCSPAAAASPQGQTILDDIVRFSLRSHAKRLRVESSSGAEEDSNGSEELPKPAEIPRQTENLTERGFSKQEEVPKEISALEGERCRLEESDDAKKQDPGKGDDRPKESSKKKRHSNKTAKLKQSKLDARREQFLAQVAAAKAATPSVQIASVTGAKVQLLRGLPG
ncbi:unnamed protein product [Closterium sp. Yama58-4]|nr:unnamed protein product [Closterium sp. Yama58-4]